ncbi:MAG: hypothetical protein ABGX47_23825 [Martelella sp.]|uniref:hypothetical protein n=1 Tax=Martelella sp. TaxID=1969699 RepID=UPI003242DB85
MNALTTCMPKGVETPEQLQAHYAAVGRRVNRAAPGHYVRPAPPPALPAPVQALFCGRFLDSDAFIGPPERLDRWLAARCAALGLRVADMRSPHRNDYLVGWRRYLIRAMHLEFPDAAKSEIARVFNKHHATVALVLAKMDRLEAAGLLKPPKEKPVPEAGHLRLGRKAYGGETPLEYVRRRAREFGFAPDEIRCGQRGRKMIKAKHLIVLELSRNYRNASLTQIAWAVGLKDHTSARHALKKMEAIEAKGFPGFESLLEMGA